MSAAHRAKIAWSQQQIERGLPPLLELVDPAWFLGTDPSSDASWSLRCQFDVAPSRQGNPSDARVQFLVDAAPHERLKPGVVLELFERSTQARARVEIID
jgi:hypothetical protein